MGRAPLTRLLLASLCLFTVTSAAAEEVEGPPGSLHGYGEVHYNNPQLGTMDDSAPAETDVHRFVLGWSYEFSPKIRMEAEVDFEHAAREIELEYAQVDFDLKPSLTARVGSLLVPVGPVNEFHEPPNYYSVERPYLQQYVIPTTWQENGAGIVGRTPNGALAYRAYILTGLDALGFTGLEGIREGRSGSSESKAADLAGVARLEVATATGLSIGASGYLGGADQDEPGLGDVTVAIGAADVRFRRGGLDLRGVFARVGVDGADSVAVATGENVGKAIQGWNVEAAYDLLRRDRSPERRRALFVFARYERFDTNEEMPAGFAADPRADRAVTSAGIDYQPIEKIALKADYEHWEDDTDDTVDRMNLGIAFEF